MSDAKAGDTVRIHYTGTLNDGTTFDSSANRDPLEFTLGSGQVIPGFDEAVTGMTVGDTKQVEIPADQAYGPVNPDARQAFPKDKIPDNIPLEVGTQLQLQAADGRPLPVRIAEVNDDHIVLDANHVLAGEDLTFDLELVEIV